DSSSCISCHARAAYDRSGRYLSVFDGPNGNVGAPDPNWFFSGLSVRRMQTDFVWSLSRACAASTSNSCR
ncbi:MAG: hypothetical protein V7695_05825, partial [Sulfitobacter sp.]